MDFEITLGEGPCNDACRREDAVEETDLVKNNGDRWVFYTPQAIAFGARAVFAFPVRIGVVRLGASASIATVGVRSRTSKRPTAI